MELSFDAVSMEYAFARLVGNEIGARGTEHDADVFRSGKPEYLADALTVAIDAIEDRMSIVKLTPSDSEAGQIGAQLQVAISRLRETASSMKDSEVKEPNDYHWGIIANLLTVINTLLVVAER